MKKIVIFGSGCHAKIVFSEILKLKRYKILGFIDDFAPKKKIVVKYKNKKYLNLGKIKDLKKYKKISGVIGVGSSILRKKIYNEIKNILKNFKFEKIISKDSIIDETVKIGDGSVVISNSVINRSTVIGKHCLINTSVSIDHDNYFDDFSGTGPGVTTGGKVKVGKLSYLGIGSTIKNTVKIGKNSFIGGSSFVNKNCLDNALYFGVPAKKIKNKK
jgi:sugar O-acyltransferase (sialic acid O-acetyltransferase NeuD family)